MPDASRHVRAPSDDFQLFGLFDDQVRNRPLRQTITNLPPQTAFTSAGRFLHDRRVPRVTDYWVIVCLRYSPEEEEEEEEEQEERR